MDESGDGSLDWRFPMAGKEIQYGGWLTVRERQVAVFVDEGEAADVFGPDVVKLTAQTLPSLTYLKRSDKKIGMGMVGDDMASSCSTRQAIPEFAKGAAAGGGGMVGDAMGLGVPASRSGKKAELLKKLVQALSRRTPTPTW